ncbi:MAG: hypothetical protein IKD73_01755 [Selenomonadaceae bacterium]|nr:hypothetical protein [Selenomonadaceae bacterium]
MEENQADFNELNNLAHEFLSSVADDLGTTSSKLRDTQRELDDLKELPTELAKTQEAQRRLEGELDYLRGEVSKLTTNNQTLTAELAKSQEARSYLQDELAKLRGELSRLNDSYQTLTTSLLKAQAELSNAKAEALTLRSRIAQAQKTLAG